MSEHSQNFYANIPFRVRVGVIGAAHLFDKTQLTNQIKQIFTDKIRGLYDEDSQKKIQQLELQANRVEALREFARLSRLRFDKGVSGYLEVLVADNELFAAELATVGLQAERYTQLINVYQAMGGGWVDIATSMAPAPQDLK